MHYKEYVGVGFLAGTVIAKKILAPDPDKALQLFNQSTSKLRLEDSYVIQVGGEILCWGFEEDDTISTK
jgi:hypothetical protein